VVHGWVAVPDELAGGLRCRAASLADPSSDQSPRRRAAGTIGAMAKRMSRPNTLKGRRPSRLVRSASTELNPFQLICMSERTPPSRWGRSMLARHGLYRSCRAMHQVAAALGNRPTAAAQVTLYPHLSTTTPAVGDFRPMVGRGAVAGRSSRPQIAGWRRSPQPSPPHAPRPSLALCFDEVEHRAALYGTGSAGRRGAACALLRVPNTADGPRGLVGSSREPARCGTFPRRLSSWRAR